MRCFRRNLRSNNSGFSAAKAYLASKRSQYYYSTRESGAAKWAKESLLLRQKCKNQVRREIPFKLQEFNSIVSQHPDLRVVVFSSITKKVLQLSDRNSAVFTGRDWVKTDVELKPDTNDDEKTASVSRCLQQIQYQYLFEILQATVIPKPLNGDAKLNA